MKASLSAAANMSGTTMALRQLESTLAGLVGQVVTSDPKINKLTDIGISTTKDGLLTIDNAKLQKELDTDAAAAEALFNPRRAPPHARSEELRVRQGSGSTDNYRW